MEITKVAIQEDGSYQVNDNVFVPDDLGNRYRRKVQAWVDAGNTPTPYSPAVKTWLENRQEAYAKLNQFELISDDAIAGNGTSHRDAILAIKAKFPKPE
jgi:hypothetical protein